MLKCYLSTGACSLVGPIELEVLEILQPAGVVAILALWAVAGWLREALVRGRIATDPNG